MSKKTTPKALAKSVDAVVDSVISQTDTENTAETSIAFSDSGGEALPPQTDSETSSEPDKNTAAPAEDSTPPETDFENAKNSPEDVRDHEDHVSETCSLITDSEVCEKDGSDPAIPGEGEDNKPLHQTESEMSKNAPEDSPGPGILKPDNSGDQTETTDELDGDAPGTGPKAEKAPAKTEKKTTKKAASSKKSTAGGRIQTRKNAFEDESDSPEPESRAETSALQPPPQQSKPATRNSGAVQQGIISIDSERSVESEQDKQRSDLLDLVESMKGKKLLSGTIQGVERSEDNPNLSFAVVYHGDFKVIIPAEEAVEAPKDFRDRDPGDVMHYLLTKRLGAEIDFIVKGADPETGIAAASRLEGMAKKRREYYFGTDRNGYNLLYEGVIAEARIISVIRSGIFVEVFGAECHIALRELSYQRLLDATSHFQPGQRVLVKLLSVNREDRSNIMITASVKQAGENPYEKALKRYVAGNRYVGTVSVVDTNGVFVSLDGGVDCLCSYPKRGRPPRGSRVTVRIIGINNESNRIWGAITHMTAPR